jgi:hypothetical protein
MKSIAEIQNGLAGFTGTEAYHRFSPLHGRMVCTDGVAWLAQNADCFWLIDIIASYQPQCSKDEMLRDFQLWTLTCESGPEGKLRKANATAPDSRCGPATVKCERDTGDRNPIVQEIPLTDFPLDTFKFYVEPGECGGKPVMVCMLPSER